MKLCNAPLVHVLVEVKFTTPPGFANFREEIQRRFHELGFSRFVQSEIQYLNITFPPAPPTMQTLPRWEFLDPECNVGFVVTPTSVVLQTTSYTSFQPFVSQLRKGLTVLKEVTGVTSITRVGLRYVDLVLPEKGEAFELFVHPGLLGYPFSELDEILSAPRLLQTQSVARTELGYLAVRSLILEPGVIIPPDLVGSSLRYPERFRGDGLGLAIDFDHFTEALPLFQIDQILTTVDKLHGSLRRAFDAVMTPFAVDRWGPWEEE